MKPILMSEVMPTLTSRHESSALKALVLLLNSPGQQKEKPRGRKGGRFSRRTVFTPHVDSRTQTVYYSATNDVTE